MRQLEARVHLLETALLLSSFRLDAWTLLVILKLYVHARPGKHISAGSIGSLYGLLQKHSSWCAVPANRNVSFQVKHLLSLLLGCEALGSLQKQAE